MWLNQIPINQPKTKCHQNNNSNEHGPGHMNEMGMLNMYTIQ